MNSEMQKAVEDAIILEHESYNLYVSLIKRASNANIETLFRTLAVEEMKHEALLREYLETGDIYAAKDKVATMYDNSFEVADKMNPAVEVVGLREGFQLAIQREKDAMGLYLGLKEKTDSEDLKDLFTLLAEAEKKHELLIKKEYDKLYS